MTSKAFGLAQLGNAYADGALSNRNILINGNFSIWQRGDYTTATAASHNTYYPDRWKIESGLSQTIQDTNRSAKVSVTSGGTNIVGLRQVVEDKNRVITLGKQVTFSAKVISNSSNARLCIYADGWSVGSAHSGNGTEETLTVTVTVPSSLTYGLIAEVSICGAGYSNVAISSGDYIEFTEAQLEAGDTATPFEHRSYGAELALCQRYYWKNQPPSLYTYIALGKSVVTYVNFHIEYPQVMRVAPTFNFSNLQVEIGTLTTALATYAGNMSALYQIYTTGGAPSGDVNPLQSALAGVGYFEANAEL
jgi:hypothetical protein